MGEQFRKYTIQTISFGLVKSNVRTRYGRGLGTISLDFTGERVGGEEPRVISDRIS